jgi:hypothetical protein
MLADALEHLVRGIVRHPDDVSVSDKQLRTSVSLKKAFWYIGATSYTGKNEFDYSGLLKFTSTKVTPVPAYAAYQKAAQAAEGCAKAASGACR